MSGSGSSLNIGNSLPLGEIPLGTAIHNIELIPNRGGQIVRAGGTSAKLLARVIILLYDYHQKKFV
jgi:large subunit ribosomal protein L2